MKIYDNRYNWDDIFNDALADRKMAFISGPRKIGKTYLAKQCLEAEANYFNWDIATFKKAWVQSPLKAIENIESGAVVFDELHKYPHWKNSLKGLYDQVGRCLSLLQGVPGLIFIKKGATAFWAGIFSIACTHSLSENVRIQRIIQISSKQEVFSVL